jgi:TfoX/Sxy family transcriptional regulator of competence genes
MAHDPAKLQVVMEAAMPADIDWRFRAMFGGIGAYANGRMCVSLSDVGLAVKLAGGEHAALLRTKGAKALQYERSSPPSKSYVVVPETMLKDRKALGDWLRISARQAAAAPAKKPRKIKPSGAKTVRKPGRS